MNLPFLPTTLTGALADLLYVAVRVAVPLLLRWWRAHQAAIVAWYDSQTTAQERAVLAEMAKAAVLWIERYASSPAGATKFKQAATLVQDWLVRRGIHVDAGEVAAAIQAAYAELRQSGVLAAAGPTLAVAPGPTPVQPP